MPTSVKLSKRVTDAATPAEKSFIIWDTGIKGYGLKIYPTNRKVFIYRYRVAGSGRKGSVKWYTIGQHGNVTVEEARNIAKQLAAEVAQGGDPAKKRQDNKQRPTFEEFTELYFERHAIPKKAPRSVTEDRRNIRLYIFPAFGKQIMADITGEQIHSLHAKLANTPTAANRTLSLLSKMFNLAEDWGMRPKHSNPCYRIPRYKENQKGRLLTDAELMRLGSVIKAAQYQQTENLCMLQALRLILFTGCRRSEISALEWKEVNLENLCINLTKGKRKGKTVFLSGPALEILLSIERLDQCNYVFPGSKQGSHIDLGKPWARLRKKADLEDVRIHDLRHNVGSRGALTIGNAMIVKEMLGHTQLATTERYMHLNNDPIRKSANKVGEEINDALEGRLAVLKVPSNI